MIVAAGAAPPRAFANARRDAERDLGAFRR